MTPLDYAQELKLYKTQGYEHSLNILRHAEQRIAQKKELLSMLSVVDKLTNLINNQAIRIATKISVYVFNDGNESGNTVELSLFDKNENLIKDTSLPDYAKILPLFEGIKNDINYLHSVFDLTPAGLIEFQKEWLGEEVYVSLEKALIAQEIVKVDNPAELKKTKKI